MRIAGLVGMVALAVSLEGASQRTAPGHPATAPDLTVYAGGGPAAVCLAKTMAGGMLAAAGVQVVWCAGRPKPNVPGSMVVHVVFIDAPSTEYQPGALASSYPFGDGVHSITVF